MGAGLSKEMTDLPFGYVTPRKDGRGLPLHTAPSHEYGQGGGSTLPGDNSPTGLDFALEPEHGRPLSLRSTATNTRFPTTGLTLPRSRVQDGSEGPPGMSIYPMGRLANLHHLGLCGKRFVELSSNIALLETTYYMQLCCNQLTAVPPEIAYMTSLTMLDLSRNRLKTLPESMGYLKNLVTLTLTDNQLTSLPRALGCLPKLSVLLVANNQLTSLPSEIGLLHSLFTLDVSQNPIRALPAEIAELPFLRKLRLHRCALLTSLPPDNSDPISASPSRWVPKLTELAARTIVRWRIPLSRRTPDTLCDYLASAQFCTYCHGPYFDHCHKRWRFLTKSNKRIPLVYNLCNPHWNNEVERVRAMFSDLPDSGLLFTARYDAEMMKQQLPAMNYKVLSRQPLPRTSYSSEAISSRKFSPLRRKDTAEAPASSHFPWWRRATERSSLNRSPRKKSSIANRGLPEPAKLADIIPDQGLLKISSRQGSSGNRKLWVSRRGSASNANAVPLARKPLTHQPYVPLALLRRHSAAVPLQIMLPYGDILPLEEVLPMPKLPEFPRLSFGASSTTNGTHQPSATAQLDNTVRSLPVNHSSGFSDQPDGFFLSQGDRNPGGRATLSTGAGFTESYMGHRRPPLQRLQLRVVAGSFNPTLQFNHGTPSIFSDPNSLMVIPSSSIYSFPASPDSLVTPTLSQTTSAHPPSALTQTVRSSRGLVIRTHTRELDLTDPEIQNSDTWSFPSESMVLPEEVSEALDSDAGITHPTVPLSSYCPLPNTTGGTHLGLTFDCHPPICHDMDPRTDGSSRERSGSEGEPVMPNTDQPDEKGEVTEFTSTLSQCTITNRHSVTGYLGLDTIARPTGFAALKPYAAVKAQRYSYGSASPLVPSEVDSPLLSPVETQHHIFPDKPFRMVELPANLGTGVYEKA
ncbi:hypothetical protein IWQ61_007942, partial [Dispira simplex]